MADEASRSGYHHVGAQSEAFHFLVVAVAVVAAVDSHAAHAVEIVGKALHSLVDLLGQFTGRAHDNAVDGILRIAAISQLAQNGQQVGCCLARPGLGHTEQVAALEDFGDAFFLNRRTVVEAHIVERIEDVVV